MGALRSFRRGRGRRYQIFGAAAVAAAVFAVIFVASSGAVLAPSTFEGDDGNMVVDVAGHTDWQSLAGSPDLRTLVDLPSGSDDNSFGQGTKEDDTTVTVVTGTIPPNKNDLTRAYLFNDRIGSSSFLYLSWERAAAIGDAHIDFELNQNATAGFDGSTVGKVTLNRTPGDLLIAYDFSGSGTPDITLFTWDGTQWGNQQDLSAQGFAEAAVNSADIPDVLNDNANVTAGEFGEASVNLSDALIAAGFNPDTCQAFGSIMVKARSSGESTTAELKDFIAPVPFHASNCPTPNIATQTSVAAMKLGQTQTVGDTATLTGGNNPTGNVSFQLYSDANCQHAVAGVHGTAALGSNGVATFSGAPFTPAQVGTYTWGVSYPGDNHNNAASACGGANEQIVVTAPVIDLAVTKSGSPASQTLGNGNTTWTMVVKNNGPDTATGVHISDPLPAGNTFVSVSTTKGSCTGGAIISCSLGTLAAGETVTITLLTTPTAAGTVTNTVTVVGNEHESNTANNTASASVQVNQFTGPRPPLVFCVAVSKVTPKQLFVGRKTKLTIHVTKNKKAVKGVHVLIKGRSVHIKTKASNSKGVITQNIKLKKAGILIFSPIASRKCNTKRVGVTGVFTPPVTG